MTSLGIGAWIVTGVVAFLSSVLSGVAGFGGAMIFLPFFLAYGLTKEAFVGTEALCAVGMHLAKSIAYQRLDVLGSGELMAGVAFGMIMSSGSYVAKNILERLSRDKFLLLVESLLTVAGLLMLINP